MPRVSKAPRDFAQLHSLSSRPGLLVFHFPDQHLLMSALKFLNLSCAEIFIVDDS